MLNPSSARQSSYGAPSTLGSVVQAVALFRRRLQYRVFCYVLSHPLPLKLIFALLRRVRRIAMLGKNVVVTKASDVRYVLDRLEDFTIADVLGPNMPWGPFMIGIDWPEQHARERNFLGSVVSGKNNVDKIKDPKKIRDEAAAKCRELISQARKSGPELVKIDVVTELSEPVVVDTIQSYFGIPVIGTRQEMARILGQVAGFVLVEPAGGFGASD